MPSYQAPGIDSLRKIGTTLESQYKNSNLSRKQLIALLKSLQAISDPNADRIILGAAIYAMEFIADTEYKGYVYSFIFKDPSKVAKEKNPSTLCKLIMNELNISDQNQLTDQDRLIYLNYFHKYTKTHFHSPAEKDVKSILPFHEQVKKVCDDVLLRLTPEIDEFLKKPPTRRFLLNQTSQLSTVYEKASPAPKGALAYFVGNKKVHEKFSKLITMFNSPEISSTFLPKYEKTNDPNKLLNDYTVLNALLLLAMLWVESEYKIRSADNSEFYKICKDTLNIQSSFDVSDAQKKKCFKDLSSVIERMKDDKPTLDFLEKNNLKDAHKFLLEIDKQLLEQIAILNDPAKCSNPTLISRAGSAIYYTGRIAVGVVAGQGAARLCKTTLESGVIKGGSTIAGYLIFGTTGAIWGGHVGTFLESTIPNFIGQYLGFGLEVAGTAFGHVIGGIVTAAVTATSAGLSLIPISFASAPAVIPDKKTEQDKEWILTLLDVLPEPKKKILLKVVDIVEVDKPSASTAVVALK